MPALYQTSAVYLKDAQKQALLKAVTDMSGATLRIPNKLVVDTEPAAGPPPIHLPLTSHQIKKMHKNTTRNRGTDLKMSRTQIKHLKKMGGGGTLMNLGDGTEGAGFRRTAAKVGKAGLIGASALAHKLEPVAIGLISKLAEHKVKEYMAGDKKPELTLKYGTGRPKKKKSIS